MSGLLLLLLSSFQTPAPWIRCVLLPGVFKRAPAALARLRLCEPGKFAVVLRLEKMAKTTCSQYA
jgi:hypothetical protein